ncbi:nucleoside deaminase [Nocardia zapadnayensis]|nr:nucleoside deaminase [Nocardia zapadnayensis]MCX0270025.1 nucleoside deaminase [Nocardia zapadnayensis]
MAAPVKLTVLELPWRLALEQGWEAFQAGNPPVGAVVTNPAGAVVACGRSRFHDRDGPSGQLSGTALAHAEVNALAQLAPGDHTALTLWSSLEPCPLCAAAAMTSRCGRVRFLAADPMWAGAELLPRLSTAVAERWPEFEGPHPGWPADWQTVLSVAFQTANGRANSETVLARVRIAPRAAGLGQKIGRDPVRRAELSALPLSDAISTALSEL